MSTLHYDDVADETEQPDGWREFVEQLRLALAAAACTGAIALSLWASAMDDAAPPRQAHFRCAGIPESLARLACYDTGAAPHHPAKGANAPFVLHPRQ